MPRLRLGIMSAVLRRLRLHKLRRPRLDLTEQYSSAISRRDSTDKVTATIRPPIVDGDSWPATGYSARENIRIVAPTYEI